MSRQLPDLVGDLNRMWADDHTLTAIAQAADVLAALHEHLPQPACDTCDGLGTVNDLICDNCGGSASLPLGATCSNHLAKPTPCADPHCDHGRLALDEWLRRVAAVWARVWMFPVEDRETTWGYGEGWQACIDHLREIGGPA